MFYIVCTVFNGYGGSCSSTMKQKNGLTKLFPTRAKAEAKARQSREDAAKRIVGPTFYGYRVEEVQE